VLHQGRYTCIRNGTQESDFPHRHFFPGLQELIDSDLPSRRDIQSVFAVGGFTPVLHQVVTQVTAADWFSSIEKSVLRAESFLARLSDEDFQQGMVALRTPGDAINQNDAVTEEIAIGSCFSGADNEAPGSCRRPATDCGFIGMAIGPRRFRS
jgi:hypothetical protein